MKVMLDLDGWRKEVNFYGSVLSGHVEVALYPPLSILTARNERDSPMAETQGAIKVIFEYRGINSNNGLPIFKYVS